MRLGLRKMFIHIWDRFLKGVTNHPCQTVNTSGFIPWFHTWFHTLCFIFSVVDFVGFIAWFHTWFRNLVSYPRFIGPGLHTFKNKYSRTYIYIYIQPRDPSRNRPKTIDLLREVAVRSLPPKDPRGGEDKETNESLSTAGL